MSRASPTWIVTSPLSGVTAVRREHHEVALGVAMPVKIRVPMSGSGSDEDLGDAVLGSDYVLLGAT